MRPIPALVAILLALPPVLRAQDPEAARRDHEQSLLAQFSEVVKGSAKEDPAERRKLVEALLAEAPFSEASVKRLQELAKSAIQKAERLAKPDQAPALVSARKQALAQARKEALKIIFDRSIYPEENHGAVGQPKVDAARAKVEEIYFVGTAMTKPEGPIGKCLAAATELVGILQTLGVQDLPTLPEEAALAKRLDEACYQASVSKRDLGIMAANHEILSKYHAEIGACIDFTNRYRMMMGLSALSVNPKLMEIAQKHSEDMVKRKFFDHVNPDGKTPGARGASGENIAFGSTDGVATTEQWLHSSGHHRNILGGYGNVGVGKEENKWTQDF